MGTPAQQQYTLGQLGKFTRGSLSLDENGILSRNSCSGDEGIESNVDALINSPKLYRIHPTVDVDTGFGRSHTVPFPTGGGADIYFDPNVDTRYATGLFSSEPATPASELAHEVLGRATQIEIGIRHGRRTGTPIRRRSNARAVRQANPAYIRMGMDPRTRYNR